MKKAVIAMCVVLAGVLGAYGKTNWKKIDAEDLVVDIKKCSPGYVYFDVNSILFIGKEKISVLNEEGKKIGKQEIFRFALFSGTITTYAYINDTDANKKLVSAVMKIVKRMDDATVYGKVCQLGEGVGIEIMDIK